MYRCVNGQIYIVSSVHPVGGAGRAWRGRQICARCSDSADEAKERGLTLKACKLRKREYRLPPSISLPAIDPVSYLLSHLPSYLVRMLEQIHPSYLVFHLLRILEENPRSYLFCVLEQDLPPYLLHILEKNLLPYLFRVLARSLLLLLPTSLPYILDCTLYPSLPSLFGPIALHSPERAVLPSPLSFPLPFRPVSRHCIPCHIPGSSATSPSLLLTRSRF